MDSNLKGLHVGILVVQVVPVGSCVSLFLHGWKSFYTGKSFLAFKASDFVGGFQHPAGKPTWLYVADGKKSVSIKVFTRFIALRTYRSSLEVQERCNCSGFMCSALSDTSRTQWDSTRSGIWE